MTSKEKIEYMLDKVREKARISPTGVFHVECVTYVYSENGVPFEDMVLLSRSEQMIILKKFESDGLLFFVEPDTDGRGAMVALQNLDKDSDENPYEKTPVLKVELKAGTLSLNELTGDVSLNERKATFTPKGRQYKFLHTLMTSKDYQANYADLITGENTKDKRRDMGFVLKEMKEALGILPQSKKENEEIFQNIRGFAYRLIT